MKIFTGIVTSKKMQKTATVSVERVMQHPLYGKRMKKTKKYQVHDEKDSAKVGSMVHFVACKPYSRTKKWTLYEKPVAAKKEVKKVKATKKK